MQTTLYKNPLLFKKRFILTMIFLVSYTMNNATTIYDGDKQVNDDGLNVEQVHPAIAMHPSGVAVMCWRDSRVDPSKIYGQRISRRGQFSGINFRISDLTNDYYESSPAIAIDQMGHFVVVWKAAQPSDDGIWARLFYANGVPKGPSFRITQEGEVGDFYEPTVIVNTTGHFTVCFRNDVFGNNRRIYIRCYNNIGSPYGPDFPVTSTATTDQFDLAMDGDDSGNIIVVWKEGPFAGPTVSLQAKRFAFNESSLGDKFRVDNHGKQVSFNKPSVVLDNNGSFLIVSSYEDGGHDRIYGQLYNILAIEEGSNFMISTSGLSGDQSQPHAIPYYNNYFVVWTSTQTGAPGIYVRQVNKSGVHSSVHQINDGGSSHTNPQAASNFWGNVLCVWRDARNTHTDIYCNLDLQYKCMHETIGSGFQGIVPISWSAPYGYTGNGPFQIGRDLFDDPYPDYSTIAIIDPTTRPMPVLMLDYIDTTIPKNDSTYYYEILCTDPSFPFFSSRSLNGATPSSEGYVIESNWTTIDPTIDGHILSEEWNDATMLDISSSDAPQPIILYIKNNQNSLYLAVDDPNDVVYDQGNILGLLFDEDHNRVWNSSLPSSEGLIYLSQIGTAFIPYAGSYPEGLIFGTGQIASEITAVVDVVSGNMQYEMEIGLSSSPLQAQVGQTIGITIAIQDPSSAYTTHYGYAGEWPPGALWEAAETTGDLILAKRTSFNSGLIADVQLVYEQQMQGAEQLGTI